MVVGNKVVKQLFKDPLLPDKFLPINWYGEKLRVKFKKWDNETTENSKPYWKKIFP
jgi:DNA-binding transcriptional regulator PaaX